MLDRVRPYVRAVSSLRAFELPAQQTARISALGSPTEAYRPIVGPRPPVWAERAEHGIRVLARLGFSPTPTIILGAVLTVCCTLRH